jgi:hypothetical protein
MADKKSDKNPHKWPDGSYHSIPWTQSRRFEQSKAGPGEIKVVGPNNTFIPVSQHDFGYGPGVLGPGGVPPTGAAPTGSAETAPGPAGPVKSSTLPVDPLFTEEESTLGATKTSGLAAVTGERGRGLSEYGFTETEPGAGKEYGDLAFDPNNPFSRASLLKRTYDVNRQGTGNQMGARGQLYAGAYQTAQNQLNYNQLGAEDTLQNSLIAFLAGNTAKKTQVGTDFNLGMIRATGDRTARAKDNPLYDPTAPPAGAAAAATAPTSATTNTPTPVKPPQGALTPGKTLPPVTSSLTTGPGVKGVKKKRKGNVITYTNSVKGP